MGVIRILFLEFNDDGSNGRLRKWEFAELPARPMIQLELDLSGKTGPEIESWIKTRIETLPADSIIKLTVTGKTSPDAATVLRAASLRALALPTMNIDARFIDHSRYQRR